MKKNAQDNQFQYHPKVNLSKQLMCAYDLFVLSKANGFSIRGIEKVLDDFSTMSGLYLNPQKSSIFHGWSK